MIYVGMTKNRDHSLELLLDLDGLNFAQESGYWIKYEVSTVEMTADQRDPRRRITCTEAGESTPTSLRMRKRYWSILIRALMQP